MRVTASNASDRDGAVARFRLQRGLGSIRSDSCLCALAALALLLTLGAQQSLGQESNPLPPTTNLIEQVSSQELLRVFLQLQEQLRATQLAIEHNRQEAKEAALQTSQSFSNGLQAIQQSVAAQRARDWAAMQESNQTMLIVVGTFAAMSFLTMLIMTVFQWRMSKGLAQISAALPGALGLAAGSEEPALVAAGLTDLHLPETAGEPESPPPRPAPAPQPPPKRFRDLTLLPGSRLFLDSSLELPRPRIRALRTAVIVGLICAAVLALVLYIVTCRKLGFGHIHAWLQI
jgi:hypothetical protein